MFNTRPSEIRTKLATISPVSQGVGTVSSGWVSMNDFHAMLAQIDVGVFGASATVDANLQQATDNAGTGAKAITGKAITQLLAAGGNNRQCLINLKEADLDTNNAFAFVQLNIVVGTAATQVAGTLWGEHPLYEDAAQFNPASVAQVI